MQGSSSNVCIGYETRVQYLELEENSLDISLESEQSVTKKARNEYKQ